MTYNYTNWNLLDLAIYNARYSAAFILVFDEDQVAVCILGTTTTASRVRHKLRCEPGMTALTLE